MNIIETEKPDGVVVAFGGQTAIKLAKPLDEQRRARSSAPTADAIDDGRGPRALRRAAGALRHPPPEGRAPSLTLEEALQAAAGGRLSRC